jgi:hypothetical protein
MSEKFGIVLPNGITLRGEVSSIEYAEPEDDVCLAGAPARRGICGDPDCVCAPLESHGGRP